MKRLVKRLLKPLWLATGPIRRPLSARLERFLRRCLTVDPFPLAVSEAMEEVPVLLDHVIRELVRLQDEVERLRSSVDEITDARDMRSVRANGARKAG